MPLGEADERREFHVPMDDIDNRKTENPDQCTDSSSGRPGGALIRL
jgi:hypothetical protein